TLSFSEYPESAYGKLARWHMDVFKPDIPGPHGRFQFHVIMGYIGFVVAFVNEHVPFPAIFGVGQGILVINPLHFTKKRAVTVLIGVADRYCMYSTPCLPVTLDPLPPISCSCTPIRLHAFIYRMIGGIGSTQCGRHLHRFVVVEQHPAGKPALSMIG